MSGAAQDSMWEQLRVLFDGEWYRSQCPDLRHGADAWEHFRRVGLAKGRDPGPFFWTAWYARKAGLNTSAHAVWHYLLLGWRMGLDPHPLFDTKWYLGEHEDVAKAAINPLVHFLQLGAAEGRAPHPLFDPKWYISQVLGVPLASALKHFIETGGSLAPHPLFSPEWYLGAYPDVAQARANPLIHYLTEGAREGRNPSPSFDTLAYLSANPLVRARGENPLAHYARTAYRGRGERAYEQKPRPPGGIGIPTIGARSIRPDHLPAIAPPSFEQRRRTRLIAFYLPQFYPIPENDRAWGTGFTEWTNVTRARSYFPEHVQPFLPSELGFYDLRLDEVRRAQVQLAREHGISAFCYYVYWFEGHRVLERPLDAHLADSALDFPFCICWANENWTRRWDGADHEIILSQQHNARTDREFMRDMVQYLRDPRYVQVDGRPLVVLYRPELLADARETAAIWRDVCRQEGIGEIHLAYVHFHCHAEPAEIGFDAVIQFPPHHFPAPDITAEVVPSGSEFEGTVRDYVAGVHALISADAQLPFRKYRGVMPGWDNTARRQARATVFHGSSPELYEAWLTTAVAARQPDDGVRDNLVFINAWNEWAEGAVLEPSQPYGRAYLEATRRVMDGGAGRLPWSAGHADIGNPSAQWLVLGHDAARAGSQIVLLGMIRELRERHGIDIRLVLLEGGELVEAYRAVAPTIVVSELAAGGHVVSMRTLAAEAENLGMDLVLTNTIATAEAGIELKRAGFRVVGIIHELVTSIRALYGPERFRTMVREFDDVLVVSEFARQSLNEAFQTSLSKRSIVNPGVPIPELDGIDRDALAARFRREAGIPQDAPIVLGCGHLHPRKGPDIFVALAREVARWTEGDRMPYFVWIGGGDPAYQEWCNHDAHALGLAKTVLFLGHLDDPAGAFAAASVFALTSREDPFPLVNLEAMGWAVPVVSFRGAGGAPEALADGAGIVVDYLDVKAMAAAVLDILRNPGRAGAMAQRARARALRLYSIGGFADRVLRAVQNSRVPERGGAGRGIREDERASPGLAAE